MSGKLYVVGTPIGNLGDISPRALETLRAADFIAAEDTRVSRKLLTRFDIHKPMISYHQHNQRDKGDSIVARILGGESCAVITDAGMPCISDPGEGLVALCAEQGIATEVIPGPSALIAALAVSGMPTGRFSFEGFLSVAKHSRMAHLEEVRTDTRTLLFYEAPHKLIHTLRDMLAVWGDRRIALARELTKIHEEVVRTTLSEAVAKYEQTTPKGEFVLVVEGAPQQENVETTLEDAVRMVRALQAQDVPLTQAAKQISRETGHKKGDLYKLALIGDDA